MRISLYVYVAQNNIQTRFNINANVVLRACSEVPMVKHTWEPTSNAAMLAADIAPRNFKGGALPAVTVTLIEAMPPLATQSEPYTFSVTATFDGNDGKTQNNASATLRINYV